MTPANAVSMVATTGATNAATGIRVGSLPVTKTGAAMPTIVATVHTASVATESPIHVGRQVADPRTFPIAHQNTRVPTLPQNLKGTETTDHRRSQRGRRIGPLLSWEVPSVFFASLS
jgi:hypothetical protein